MGDMKTPDFDDLLAAFDIPDATGLDAKEAIQESHEESESHLKQTGACLEESLLHTQDADVPVVSVIVKNSSRHEALDSPDESPHSGTIENGFKGLETLADLTEANSSGFPALNRNSTGECLGNTSLQQKADGTFSQPLSVFSPVSCLGSEVAKYERDETHPNKERDSFTDSLIKPLTLDYPKKDHVNLSDQSTKDTQKDDNNGAEISQFQESYGNWTDKTPELLSDSSNKPDSKSADVPNTYSKSQSKLSSCLEALAALNAQRDPSEPAALQNECMKVPISPCSPRSPLDSVKRLMKPSDSPVSVCSDSSGKASPAIPRVRIKTIKTTSGHIKRTVTSVLPDSETDEVHSAYESSPCRSMVSEDSYNMSPSQSVASDVTKPATVGKSSAKVVLNQNKAISRQLQSAAVMNNKRQSTVSKGQKPKKSSLIGSSPNANSVPKAIHLASLNLVPHSVAASVAARSTCNQPTPHTLSSTVYSSVPLVHQVKSAAPYRPNTAAGTLNTLLNHSNPLPTYVPDLNPPPESNISLPPRGHCCLECGDSFGVERSLVFHYSRRSVHIELTCTHCKKTLVFFNRCALLAHAREHKNNGTVMQCTQLYMKPIAEEHMFVPLGTEALTVDSCSFKSSSQKNQPVMPLYQDSVVRQRLCCLECNKQLVDLTALAGHYQSVLEVTDALMCKVCSMFLPNKCSFGAHQRLHAHKSPYCCPECGVLRRSADIQKHVKDNCLHYARKAWYKCLHCDLVFKSLQGQKTHIEEKHCEMFFKCSVCPVAFKTSERCDVHLKNKHNSSKLSPQLIFKCSCETVFKKKHLLFQHFHEDAYKRVTCVFKCPKCHSVFALKQQLMQHYKGAHLDNTEKSQREKAARMDQDLECVQQKMAEDQVKYTDGPRRKSQARAGSAPSGWTCGDCLQWFSEREAYVSHVKSSHGKPVKRYLCRHCGQSFNFSTSLRKHIRKDHDGKHKNYVCWYCTDSKTKYTSSVMLKNHMSLMHGIKNPEVSLMPTSLSQDSSSTRKELGSEKTNGSATVCGEDCGDSEGPSAKRLKRQFRCANCGYVTADRSEFEEHIPQHKSDEGTPQCHQCGLCFTSALALNRHLYIVHKVKEHT